ncbi:class I adenylate-forming enzyme family protein [Risungbinella massiliensis]|uniref:class I adenylate-forming enzyme family protein n=1 Tax=Risungbinella massiliensis TaxID=1329796 RepID=UPI0005CC6AC0|nr:class I adenylate-forming enzyme family protein [Risungbinella massiliensis]
MSPISSTLGGMLRSSALHYGNMEALVSPSLRITYKEYEKITNQLAHFLIDKGIQKGDRVGMMLGINPAYPIALMAVAKTGAIAVVMNYMWSQDLAEWAVDHTDCKYLFYEDQFAPKVKPKLMQSGIPSTQMVEQHTLTKHFWKEIENYPVTPPKISITGNEPVAITFTSGTTGRPKGVLANHNAFFSSGINTTATLETKPGDRFLLAMPLFHISGTIVIAYQPFMKYTLVFLPQLEPMKLLDIMENEKVNLTFMPPTLLSVMLTLIDQSDHLLANFERFVSGGTKVPIPVIKGFEELGFKVVEVYGSTESTGIVASWKPDFGYDTCHTVGKPYLFPEVVVLDRETREILPNGEIGELAIRGPQLFMGYWKNEKATKESFHQDYFLTGDAARMDDEGFIEIIDRYKDVIFFSGFGGVYPSEIEKILLEIPGIVEASVVGAYHPRWGEFPCAFVYLEEQVNLTKEDILAQVHSQVDRYKLAEVIILSHQLPRNATGKLDKNRMKEIYQEMVMESSS